MYSNWGMGFAGCLVEAVSGISFYDYVEQNVFQPLGMMRSEFPATLPAEPFSVCGDSRSGDNLLTKPRSSSIRQSRS